MAGLLEDRLGKARERLEETREAVKALASRWRPRGTRRPTSATSARRIRQRRDSSRTTSRSAWRSTSTWRHLVRAYANLANELAEAGYSPAEIETIKAEVEHYEKVRNEVKLASGDYIDLKMYEPAMRHLIDTYIRAEESKKISAFDDMSLVQLIVERGAGAVEACPRASRRTRKPWPRPSRTTSAS